MTVWQELIQLALMGADRGHLSGAAKAQLKALGVPEGASAERQLLEGAAILHQFRRAALELPLFPGPLPPPVDAGDTSPCGPRSSHHLQLILRGDFRSALPEFVEHLRPAGRRLPPESLPPLFDQCLTDPVLWRQLGSAIGPVGRWLLRQNPAWAPLHTDVDPASWPVAGHQERRQILRSLRRTDPERARTLLKETWAIESYRDKLSFLEVLESTLQAPDAAFLESVLDDRRKEVRLTAAELLSRLATSDLVGRLFGQAVRFIQLDGADGLDVQLPAAIEEAWLRDGIREKPPADYNVGPRAGWLLQLVARVPPSRWESHWNQPAAACLERFTKTEWGAGFTVALTEAAVRHDDPRWQEALLLLWMAASDEPSGQSAAAEVLLRRLPMDVINRVVVPWLERRGGQVEEQSPVGRLLLLYPSAWSESLALVVIQGIQQWLAGAEAVFGSPAFYRRLLEVAAYRSPPALLEQIRRGWPMQTRGWMRWEESVEQFLNTLVFRREMIRALQEG